MFVVAGLAAAVAAAVVEEEQAVLTAAEVVSDGEVRPCDWVWRVAVAWYCVKLICWK